MIKRYAFLAVVLACNTKPTPTTNRLMKEDASSTIELDASRIEILTRTDSANDQTEIQLIRPSSTQVPIPSNETRFPEFENFSNITGLVGDRWHCYRGEYGTHWCYPNLVICEQLRRSQIDTGHHPTNCRPEDEVWCFASIRNGNRFASCFNTYNSCSSSRNILVRYNILGIYSNISRCRAFR